MYKGSAAKAVCVDLRPFELDIGCCGGGVKLFARFGADNGVGYARSGYAGRPPGKGDLSFGEPGMRR